MSWAAQKTRNIHWWWCEEDGHDKMWTSLILMVGSLSTTRHKTTVDERWKNFPKEEIIKSLLFIIKYCNFLVSPPAIAIDHSCLVAVDSFRWLLVGWIVCYVNKLRAINYRQLPFTFSTRSSIGLDVLQSSSPIQAYIPPLQFTLHRLPEIDQAANDNIIIESPSLV